MDQLIRLERRFAGVFLALAGCTLSAVMLLTSYQIFQRFVVGDPSSWSEAAARLALVWTVFLSLPTVFQRGLMIAIDALLNIASDRVKKVVHIVVAIASLAFLLILVVAGFAMTKLAMNQNIAGLNISMAFMYGALPLGAAASIPSVVVRTIKLLIDPNLPERERTQNLEATQ